MCRPDNKSIRQSPKIFLVANIRGDTRDIRNLNPATYKCNHNHQLELWQKSRESMTRSSSSFSLFQLFIMVFYSRNISLFVKRKIFGSISELWVLSTENRNMRSLFHLDDLDWWKHVSERHDRFKKIRLHVLLFDTHTHNRSTVNIYTIHPHTSSMRKFYIDNPERRFFQRDVLSFWNFQENKKKWFRSLKVGGKTEEDSTKISFPFSIAKDKRRSVYLSSSCLCYVWSSSTRRTLWGIRRERRRRRVENTISKSSCTIYLLGQTRWY